jgi:hypothetical protein
LVIFLSMSSWIELIRCMASTKTLLFLSMASITSLKHSSSSKLQCSQVLCFLQSLF